MGRIAETFAALRQSRETALVSYLVAGDPSQSQSLAALQACCDGGADLLEIGICFSDPMADGEAVQRGHERALASGMTRQKFWQLLRDFRAQDSQTPIVLMGYYNSLLAQGVADFVAVAADCGADGLLIVDLPLEEQGLLRDKAQAAGLDTIPLIAPGTPPARIEQIVAAASGYLYYVSYRGVTGLARLRTDEVQANIDTVRQMAGELPLAVGFGVRTPQDAAALAEWADGVVVGSALVDCCGEEPFCPQDLQQRVADLKAGLKA